jgi:ankyrin repeat protein
LLEAGADPNARDKSGVAPLHRAARTRCSGAVRALLAGGALAKLQSDSGSTALQLAEKSTGRGGSGSSAAKREQELILQLLRG